MIGDIFKVLIEDHLAHYIRIKTANNTTETIITFGSISQLNDPSSDSLKNNIVMGLVNIEEDRISRPQDNYVRTPDLTFKKPPVFLNLYVLFVANFDATNYESSLNYITWVIKFFQSQNVFNHVNSPGLPAAVDELIFDMKTLSFQDMNNLWGVLGCKYMPSVLYKVRLVSVSDDFTLGPGIPVQNIAIDDNPLETV
jgi:hypothetical protein